MNLHLISIALGLLTGVSARLLCKHFLQSGLWSCVCTLPMYVCPFHSVMQASLTLKASAIQAYGVISVQANKLFVLDG